MRPELILIWIALGYVLLQAARYLLGVRIYLTCALREVRVQALERQRVDAGELRVLSLLDTDLAAAGFRHLGFMSVPTLVTYFGEPLTVSVFVNERIPAYALVRPRLAPEYGRLVELELATVLASGHQIDTLNSPVTRVFLPMRLRVEAFPDMPVAGLSERHSARVAGESTSGVAPPDHSGLEGAMRMVAANMADLRTEFRGRGWVVPTVDSALDRFTLRGAVALTHYSRRVYANGSRTQLHAPPVPSEEQRMLRVEADLRAVMHTSDNPESAPGTPWPLIAVIVATALISLAAMTWLWSFYVAVVILAAVAFHEAGHATAMRMFGYRDVHIFFVPLLGAVTVGRPVNTTVRDRLTVLLAGPVPGLWLAVLLLELDQIYGPVGVLRAAALALLILNALNLLPFTPLDGGRAMEALNRPESVWRLVSHGGSAIGLLVLAAFLRDPLIAGLGLVWAALLPRQLQGYRLRRAVARRVRDRMDFGGVVRVTLETLAGPEYRKWHAAGRQVNARAIARLFAESVATTADLRWGVLAYAAAWIPAVAAALLWSR